MRRLQHLDNKKIGTVYAIPQFPQTFISADSLICPNARFHPPFFPSDRGFIGYGICIVVSGHRYQWLECKLLGWTPAISLREGLARTISYFEQRLQKSEA